VHEHPIVVPSAARNGDQAVAHAFRARRAADWQEFDSLGIHGQPLPLRVTGRDDHENSVDAAVGQNRVDRMLEHRLRSDPCVLLRSLGGTHASSGARSGDQG
jgi:hypothetical protein